MDNFNKNPLKMYIQDIFRAKQTEENQYVYELFSYKFKNVMVHGVVTAIYNNTETTTYFELSDPTGNVQVYYDSTKDNTKISDDNIKDLVKTFARKPTSEHYDNILTMSYLLNSIEKNNRNPFNFETGSHVGIVGDIFVDDFSNVRKICAYSCKATSVDRDIVWLEELRYIYDNYYLNATS